jgi:hypothetical protein
MLTKLKSYFMSDNTCALCKALTQENDKLRKQLCNIELYTKEIEDKAIILKDSLTKCESERLKYSETLQEEVIKEQVANPVQKIPLLFRDSWEDCRISLTPQEEVIKEQTANPVTKPKLESEWSTIPSSDYKILAMNNDGLWHEIDMTRSSAKIVYKKQGVK